MNTQRCIFTQVYPSENVYNNNHIIHNYGTCSVVGLVVILALHNVISLANINPILFLTRNLSIYRYKVL